MKELLKKASNTYEEKVSELNDDPESVKVSDDLEKDF